MKTLTAISAVLGLLLVAGGERPGVTRAPVDHTAIAVGDAFVPRDDDAEVVQRYCVRCHNERRLAGNMSLEGYDPASPERNAALSERMIRKLRAGMMPPPGARRPAGDTLLHLVEGLEEALDRHARDNPNPGARPFQRLNQAEYARAVRDLLALDIDPGQYLPPDTKSENFDNIADVQALSPTLLDAYLNAAAEISRLAVGDPRARSSEHVYHVSGYRSQVERVPGAPFGTRGGVSVVHTFPADGEYTFRIAFHHTTTGDGFFGQIARFEQLEVSVNGEPMALLDVDQWMRISDPEGISMLTEPIFVRAGPQRVTAAFVRRTEGPAEDLVSPHDWSLADRHTGISGYGLTLLPHVRDLIVIGPHRVTGVSDTPSRQRIFSCRPVAPEEAPACAREILERVATLAYRRPLTERDVEILLSFYEESAEAGFEAGVRTGLQAILASPHFLFRFEEAPAGAGPGATYRIDDLDLASRLSFFLWGSAPDDELLALAESGGLSDAEGLEARTREMLADPRSEALGRRFAAQWLRLQDLDKVHPDQFWFPDYDEQLAEAMRAETELFFNGLVRDDRSVLELFSADYTYLNERLAAHYGVAGVRGEDFRRVPYPDDRRRGLLGHGSVLTLTSHANRTSPVLRGKWVMEVLLGTPPPPPPPDVPELDETAGDDEGRLLTTRERLEMHRASPACNSCHRLMDPIGLALDNFDVTGRWRIRENGVALDTQGELYDGTPITKPAELQAALLTRPIPLVRTFTENLMAYALGRHVEHYDQPTVRAIARAAESEGYRISEFIVGVVTSDAFQMQRVADETQPDPMGSHAPGD